MDEDRWRVIKSAACPSKCGTYDGFSRRASTCPVAPTCDGARELIRKSLISFDPEQAQIRPIRRRGRRDSALGAAAAPPPLRLC